MKKRMPMKSFGLLLITSIALMAPISFGQTLYISELVADNGNSLLDEDGDSPDWIELHNPSDQSVSIDGWYLTDSITNLTKWAFPETQIPAKGFLLIFASDKNRATTGSELHTNFKLSAAGESVVLVQGDGTTIINQMTYPELQKDDSFGYAFSPAETFTALDTGAPCSAHVPTNEVDAAGWTLHGFDNSGWLTGTTGVGYERSTTATIRYTSLIGLDVESMRGKNQSVYIRAPFSMTNTVALGSLTLKMKYDDAFVAYLNGTRTISSANVPDPLVWDSGATSGHSDSEAIQYVQYDLSPYLSELIEGNNILAIHGLNASINNSDLLFVPKIQGSHIGDINTAELGRLDAATPGAGNTSVAYAGTIEETPIASPERGFYDAPFNVTLSNVTAGATLRYTRDGSMPTDASPLYSGPIPISSTTTLRIRSFIDGYKPSPPRTHSYIFVNDVVFQPPSTNTINGQILIFGMDEGVRNKTYYDAHGQVVTVQDALKSIPSLCISTDDENLYDPETGIYVNAAQRWERAASFELIHPDGRDGFHINAGLRIRGGWSRHSNYPKHSFRLFFKNEYGASTLDYPLFEDEGVQSFNKIDLRTAQNYNWVNSNYEKQLKNSFVRDVFCRDTSGAMGSEYTRSRYYHLYLNGLYWGLYMTEERPVADFGADYSGGDPDDYDAVKATSWTDPLPRHVEATDGNLDAYYRLFDAAMAGFTNSTDYFAVQGLDPAGQPDPTLEKLLDLNNMIDYQLLIYYTGASDNGLTWFGGNKQVNNMFALYNRVNPDGFKWVQHDCEHALDTSTDLNRTGPFTNSNFTLPEFFNAQTLHEKLSVNPEYRLAFADRMHKHFKNNGALMQSNCEARLDDRAAQIDQAIVANAARWGNTDLDRDRWIVAVSNARAFFQGRINTVRGYLAEDGFVQSVEPPTLSHVGGAAPAGTAVNLSSAAGTIYYTTDGTDPRAVGGAVNGLAFSEPVLISRPTHLKARVLFNGEWSALTEATYWTPRIPLAITELMYHAPDGNPHDFIELQNISDETVSLKGYKLDNAIDYRFKFGPASLAPGEYVVAVDDMDAFSGTYATNGILIAGEYAGDFSNSGEKVDLEFRGKDLISFSYSDARNWPQAADGAGHSLVPLDSAMDSQEQGSLDYGGNWRASTHINGSPGYFDPVEGPGIVLNEIIAHTDTGLSPPFDSNDKIELYNPTDSTVTLHGWHLSDDRDTLSKFAIPNGTTIPAFGFIVFDEDDFHPGRTNGFGLDKAGEQVFLSAPDRVVDALRFKGQENGVSIGRYPDGAADWSTTTPTAGTANHPVTSSLQLNELMYHPLLPAGNELEYIQIRNVGISTAHFSNSTGSYRIDGGVSYLFPAGTSLAPDEELWLVSFDPAVETAQLAQFRTAYGLGASDIVYGPYKGELSNRGERVALERPQDSDDPLRPLDISWVVIDELFYFDQAPWPTTADGEGNPLIRTGLSSWNVPFIPGIGISESTFHHLIRSEQTPPDDSVEIWNSGLSTLNYSISTDAPWLSASPANGSSTGEQANVVLSYDLTGLTAGTYSGRVEISSIDAFNSPRVVEVMMEIYEPELDHFSWEPIEPNPYVNQPFSAMLTAFDQHNIIMSSFSDSVSITVKEGAALAPEVQIGSGASSWEYPLSTYYHDARTQVIYLQSEIGAAGSVNSLALNVNSVPGQLLENWTIRLRHTALNSYGSSPAWEDTWTTVYQTNQTIASTGWVVFEFNAPFEYDGINNLMVDFSHNNSSWTSDGTCLATAMATDRALYSRTDSNYGDPLNWSGISDPPPSLGATVPDIKLGRIVNNSIPISPTETGPFTHGIWSGLLTLQQAVSNVILTADDHAGHTSESNPFNVTPDPDDLDGDGISDAWEINFFSDPANCIASNDVDHDGQSNLQEYIAGMDPTNAASYFTAELDTQLPDGFVVHWNAVTGRVYDVLWAPDLMRGFRILKPAIPYPVNSYTDRVHSASSSGYYLVTVHLPSATDSDGDGLPDVWESQFFNHPISAFAAHDADSDGQSNLEEYVAGTNPTNILSRFSIDVLNTNVIHWTPRAGRSYSVFWTDDLAKPFIRIASDLSTGSYTDSLHAGILVNYYRIQVKKE